ncbi:hypothetical protein ALC53_09505 [Atta colombica]|uniref:Uncharacterized protein n=1 Tax=Atta colombica TaxID=520822 RepID=A0A195B708_9HYME|nr:hypothetical protein ALC53_09505 [Atta colombica]
MRSIKSAEWIRPQCRRKEESPYFTLVTFTEWGDAQLNSGVCFFWKIGGKTRGILRAIRSRHIYNAESELSR